MNSSEIPVPPLVSSSDMGRLALALLFLALPLIAAPKPHPSPKWAPSWSDAVEEARALNLPIVVHRHGFY